MVDIGVLGYMASGDVSEDVLALYQGADFFVCPSFYEGWGLRVHEATLSFRAGIAGE